MSRAVKAAIVSLLLLAASALAGPVSWFEYNESPEKNQPIQVREGFDKAVLACEDAVRKWSKLSRGDKMDFCEFVHYVSQQEFCIDPKYSDRINRLTTLERKTRPLVGLPQMRGAH